MAWPERWELLKTQEGRQQFRKELEPMRLPVQLTPDPGHREGVEREAGGKESQCTCSQAVLGEGGVGRGAVQHMGMALTRRGPGGYGDKYKAVGLDGTGDIKESGGAADGARQKTFQVAVCIHVCVRAHTLAHLPTRK